MLSRRPSILVSVAPQERLYQLCEVHDLVTYVLRGHKNHMQARSQLLTTPQFEQGNSVSIISKGLFLRGQLKRKLKSRQLGPFTMVEKIGAKLHIGVIII
jgi:hypothetical protein